MESDGKKQERLETQGLSILAFFSGVWLVASPFIFSYGGTIRSDQIVVGIAITILSIVRYFALQAVWASWLSALGGLWLIMAPYLLNSASTAAHWSSVIGGIVALTVSILAAQHEHPQLHHRGHGHPAV